MTGSRPTFGSWMGSMWLYTLLRFALFGVLWGVFVLLGFHGLTAALFGVVLSVPLSFVLLAGPRRRFAANVEARMTQHHDRRVELDHDLDPHNDDTP
ncbi:MAG: DUF4229 domain-containing protein [Jatrophihabitans sp.]|nr:MAG: DUF4229 domain-containing protein [Jatrophihabitans sp.]